MINTIIFDIGGVLITDASHNLMSYVSELTGLSYSRVRKSFHEYWKKWKVGSISSGEFWEGFVKDLKMGDIDILDLKSTTLERTGEVEQMFGLADSLKAKGYRVGIISNNSTEWAEWAESKFNISGRFDAVALSNYEGVAKPDPKIYRICLKKLKAKPEECVYIDNKEENLKPARDVGMGAIHFKGQRQLEKDLEKMGVV